MCEKSDVFASACAIAKAFPLYNRKTGKSSEESKAGETLTTVEFLIATRTADDEFEVGNVKLADDELQLLEVTTWATRNTARIVDTPCSEMHTDRFVEVSK